MIKVFYHIRDFDGKCCGAVLKRKYPEAKLIGFDYGWDFPWGEVEVEDTVIMADVSLPVKDMFRLTASCRQFIWFDHHKNIIEQVRDAGLYLSGVREFDSGKAACRLVWEYYFDEKIPRAIKWISDYDIWNHDDPNVLPFQTALKAGQFSAEHSAFWNSLFNEDKDLIDFLIGKGTTEMAVVKALNAAKCFNSSFVTEFEGYRTLAVNFGPTNSLFFESKWDENIHDIMLAYHQNREGKWEFSVYTTKDIYVSAIARKYGGNGHPKAAGFTLECQEAFNLLESLIIKD